MAWARESTANASFSWGAVSHAVLLQKTLLGCLAAFFFLGISLCHTLQMWISDFLSLSHPLCHISVIVPLICFLASFQCLGFEQILPLSLLSFSPLHVVPLFFPLLYSHSFPSLSWALSSPFPSLPPYQTSSSRCPFYLSWVSATHLPVPAHPCSSKAWGCAGGQGHCCKSGTHPLSSFPSHWELVLSLTAGDVCLTWMNFASFLRR